MGAKKFSLAADIITDDPKRTLPVLTDLFGPDSILKIDHGFRVRTTMEGETARELNRSLLSSLRRLSKRTTLRAEWTNNGVTERFFDYVPRGIRTG